MNINLKLNHFAPPLLLFLVTIAVYAVCGSFGMLNSWDDDLYLQLNDTITSFTLPHLKEALSSYYVGNYAPLNIISFMVDHALWGLNPAGYHLENVLLHALNGLLLFYLLRRLAISEWQAAAATWIFLFHPVQVESVAWISQRKNLLAMLFFLMALIAYQAYRHNKNVKLPAYLLATFALLAAVLCKSIAVIFPAVALLYDFCHRHDASRPGWQMLADKVPFLLIAATAALMALMSQSPENMGGRSGYPGGTPYSAFLTMVPVLAGYLRDCCWPFELSPFYAIPLRYSPDGVFFITLGVVVLLVAGGIYLYRHVRPMLFWYGLFFIALLPVMQFIPLITLKHDRYLYFSLPGFAVVSVCAAGWLYKRLPSVLARCLQISTICIMLSLPLLAYQQSLVWRNDITLWQKAVTVDPENRLGWRMLALSYTRRGEVDKACQAFKRLTELHDKYGPVDERDYL